MADTSDLAIRAHTNVFIIDGVAIFRECIDDDLANEPIPLVVDPGALLIDELNCGFGVLLALDWTKLENEQH